MNDLLIYSTEKTQNNIFGEFQKACLKKWFKDFP